MPRRKLDDELIKDIAIYRGHGMSWRNIARKLGIPRATLQGWIKQGKAATRNTPVKRLYDAIGKAEADVIYKSAATIIQTATETRVTKIQAREKLDRNGNVHLLTTTTKEGPSWQAALAILERFSKKWRLRKGKDVTDIPDTEGDAQAINELDNAFDRAETEAKDEK